MPDPAAVARRVLGSKEVSGIPALSLQAIARSEGMKSRTDDFPDAWEGALISIGAKRFILVNARIGNQNRQRFTFAHELGHHFLGHPLGILPDGQTGIRCTPEDIQGGKKPREVEANHFAVELLMPEERFSLDMAGAPIDFTLIGSLSNQYMVSKQACGYRIAALTKSPCIIARSQNGKILDATASRSARGHLRHLDGLPSGTDAWEAAQSRRTSGGFVPCDAQKWLLRDIPVNTLYECTHVHTESGMAMTILKW